MISETMQLIAQNSPAWMREALCGDDPELFFPEPGEDAEAAIRICEHCPVRAWCLQWAFETGDRHAILGGKTPYQRTVIARTMLAGKSARERARIIWRIAWTPRKRARGNAVKPRLGHQLL